jgi:hypothetical protein
VSPSRDNDKGGGRVVAHIPLGDGVLMPEWITDGDYLSDRQANRMHERTKWAVLIGKGKLSSSAHHVALRLHLWTKDDSAVSWPSIPSLARDTKLSQNTVRTALRALEAQGWLVITPQRYDSGKQASSLYRLAWPAVDVIAGTDLNATRCWEPTKKAGKVCLRAAGWGTDLHEGPCVLHGGNAAREQAPLQPLKGPPSTIEGPTPSTIEQAPLQPLKANEEVENDESLNDKHSQARRTLTERRAAEMRFASDLRAEGRDEGEVRQLIVSMRERLS